MLALKKNQKKLYVGISILLIVAGFLFFDIKLAGAAADKPWYEVYSVSGALSTSLGWVIKQLLLAILVVMSYLMSIAATIFEWIIVPENMKAIMNNTAIYAIWTLVRDTLNIAFIMMLLFSAFCTVFQISKYNYKIILNLLLMALLVNFSFPITRFIIDFSNILMYYFLNQLGGSGSFASIADTGGLAGILNPHDPSLSLLIVTVIFSFIFAVTLLAIAVLLVIRTAVLAILIILSPIAFVGSVVPGLSSHASTWWTQLFNNCFFGPVMIFMIYIATEMMKVLSSPQFSQFRVVAGDQTMPDLKNFITTASFFIIPIIILWIGIGMAQKMSAAGAGAVMGRAKKFMNWAPSSIAKATGVPGGVKKAANYYKQTGAPGFLGKIPGLRGSEKTAATEAWIASKLGVKGALEVDMKNRAEEYKKTKSLPEIQNLAKKGDAAAAYALADMKEMDGETYAAFTAKNKNPKVKKTLDAKVKQNRADVVALSLANDPNSQEYKDTYAVVAAANPGWTQNQISNQTRDEVAETAMGKLSAEKLADQDFVSIDKKMPAGPDKTRLTGAIVKSINNLAGPAKAELGKRLSGANRAAINKLAGTPII